MFGAILTIHIVVCSGLVVVVLLQSGKGGGLAGAFGGAGGVGAVFGGQAAATFLTKATRYLAIGFMLTSMGMALALRGTLGGGTVAETLQERQPASATTAGEVVEPGEVPAELPGSGSEVQEAVPGETQESAPAETPDESSGGQIPVVPETE